ncbi:hypothetical protein TSACC_21275 [Terrimicrobium sacchariphilum]|uniref:Uncharacterized protein n=1 Tax=Terrimicrobium sacchariphilum TaxID=690879 RepID=A0A146G661_TERSA|nr:hypothetical protein [Terrimicrobium sacchariphilum]GAT32873.1 hypothetical protein TSACC_21275 [Terrimicrobium sacchariphilum]
MKPSLFGVTALFTCSAALQANTVFQDDFSKANATGSEKAGTVESSGNWQGGRSAVGVDLVADPALGAGQSMQIHFPPNASVYTTFEPVSLENVGDKIEVKFRCRFPTEQGPAISGLRFGLYNVEDEGKTINGSGYMMTIDPATGKGPSISFDPNTSEKTMLGGSDPVPIVAFGGTAKPFGTEAHIITFTLEKAADGVHIAWSLDNVPSAQGVDANSSATTFNAFVLGLGGRTDSINIDDVVITKTP